MASTPIKINDRRGQPKFFSSVGNRLFKAGHKTVDREVLPQLDRDYHSLVSPFARRNLMTLGRWLCANFPIIEGVIDEMATFSVSSFIPQFYGQNAAWGREAEAWLSEHDKICDVAGWPYDMANYRRALISGVLRDGDVGTLLTETQDGYPLLQIIPAHRIGGVNCSDVAEGGQWDGAKIVDGVIVDPFNRPLAYRIADESSETGFTDVSANNFFLSFIPIYPGQVRGVSRTASSAFDLQDVSEARSWELTVMKLAASVGLIEHNETGEFDEAKNLLSIGSTQDEITEALTQASACRTERINGVVNRYYKAGTGMKLETLQSDRPTANVQAFEDRILRGCLHGLGWSVDFSLDPNKTGGAAMRVVVEKMNRQIEKLQSLIARPACRRFDGYRLSKAVNLGLLPFDPDWFKFNYQGPAELTADAKYNSDVDAQEVKLGFKSYQKACEERNEYWEDVMDNNIAFRKRLEARCKEEGVDPGNVILLTPNGNPATQNPPQDNQSNQ